jgi:hypothetical protein
MGTTMADLAPQLEFVGENWAGSVRAMQTVLGGTSGRHSQGISFNTNLVHRLSRLVMRHTMTQTRNGRSLLELPQRHDRCIKVSFLPAEKLTYDAIAADVRKLWDSLVAKDAVAQVVPGSIGFLCMHVCVLCVYFFRFADLMKVFCSGNSNCVISTHHCSPHPQSEHDSSLGNARRSSWRVLAGCLYVGSCQELRRR